MAQSNQLVRELAPFDADAMLLAHGLAEFLLGDRLAVLLPILPADRLDLIES